MVQQQKMDGAACAWCGLGCGSLYGLLQHLAACHRRCSHIYEVCCRLLLSLVWLTSHVSIRSLLDAAHTCCIGGTGIIVAKSYLAKLTSCCWHALTHWTQCNDGAHVVVVRPTSDWRSEERQQAATIREEQRALRQELRVSEAVRWSSRGFIQYCCEYCCRYYCRYHCRC